MSSLQVVFTELAARQIRGLSPVVKKGVRMSVDELKSNPLAGKPLREDLAGLRSHRYKRYRLIYRLSENGNLIKIVFVGERKNVYQLLTKLLKKS